MGLDMYMYRIRRLNDNEVEQINKTRGNGADRSFIFMNKADFDSEPEYREDLIPFLREVKIVQPMFDQDRLFNDHNVDPDDEISFCYGGCNGFGWNFVSGKQISISEEEYSMYSYDAITEMYVFAAEEVAYWRKYDALAAFIEYIRVATRTNELIAQGETLTDKDINSWKTQNCGYYLLSKAEKQAIKEFLISERLDSHSDEDYCYEEFWDNDDDIFYEAWW